MDPRVKIVGSQRVGLVEALVQTIAKSDAEFLARMDSDDISHPLRLEEQIALLDNRKDIAIASCKVRHISSGPLPGGMRRYEEWLNSLITPDQIERDLLVESPLCHPSVLMRREAYDQTNGYQDDDNPEDYGLWLDFAKRGEHMAKVDKELFFWRDSSDRLSRTHPRYEPSRFLAAKINYLLSTFLKQHKVVSVWGAGKHGRRWSRALGSIKIEVSEFIDIDKKKIGHRVHQKPVIPPPHSPHQLKANAMLVAVGSRKARAMIRQHLLDKKFRELKDFVCVA